MSRRLLQQIAQKGLSHYCCHGHLPTDQKTCVSACLLRAASWPTADDLAAGTCRGVAEVRSLLHICGKLYTHCANLCGSVTCSKDCFPGYGLQNAHVTENDSLLKGPESACCCSLELELVQLIMRSYCPSYGCGTVTLCTGPVGSHTICSGMCVLPVAYICLPHA